MPIHGKKFYRKYVSKSLPCVFRKEVIKDKLYLDISSAKTRDELDEILGKKF